MPVYIVTGKLGSGKTLAMVGRIRDYLWSGRAVVSNIDLNIRELVQDRPDLMPVRLPDRPTVEDLEALGACHTTCREELNGAIVLDECGTWLNSREWSGKGRAKLIDWLLHSRKRGWDVFFIIQNISLMDKQIREAMAEYVVFCKRLDRISIPLFGAMMRFMSWGRLTGRFPKIHLANVCYGTGPNAITAEQWRYKGESLYAAYSSGQIIGEEAEGMYSLLWYRTDAELAAERARLPKPKLAWVERLMDLPANARIPAMRQLALGYGPA